MRIAVGDFLREHVETHKATMTSQENIRHAVTPATSPYPANLTTYSRAYNLNTTLRKFLVWQSKAGCLEAVKELLQVYLEI